MSISNVVELLTGVTLFLFGMSLMGDNLKKVAGNKLELVLYRLSSTPFKGILLGTAVTAVIQSSSATSVMVVGFVNSQMMKIKQAIGVIMGAIIGTSITGWIICLSSVGGKGSGVFEILSTDTLTAVIAVVGIILRMFTKPEKNHNLGNILLGFAVLMCGISTMSGSVAPLRESPAFIDMLTSFSNPLLGILIGLAFTSIIQSASAAVGILQALAVTGAISFSLALPVIMGIAIGAAVPVLLSALGAGANGKRTAFTYLMVDTLGVIIFSIFFYTLNSIFNFSIMSMTMNMVTIALLNTVFRITIVLFLSPFIGLMEKMVTKLIPDKTEDIEELKDIYRLEERFLEYPPLSIEQSRLAASSMASYTKQALHNSFSLLAKYDKQGFSRVLELEDITDIYEDKLGSYLAKIMRKELNKEQNDAVSLYFHTITDFERMGDHAKNIAECALEIEEKQIKFTPAAMKELRRLGAAAYEIVDLAVDAFANNNLESAYRIEPLEEIIDNLCDTMKLRHVKRIQDGKCQYEHGFVFNDLLTNFERIGDHCSNIGIAITTNGSDIGSHFYSKHIEDEKEHGFDKTLREYKSKYSI